MALDCKSYFAGKKRRDAVLSRKGLNQSYYVKFSL